MKDNGDVTPQQEVIADVHIVHRADGGVSVKAPTNLVLALGLIEAGKHVLLSQYQEVEREARAANSNIVIPHPVIRGPLK